MTVFENNATWFGTTALSKNLSHNIRSILGWLFDFHHKFMSVSNYNFILSAKITIYQHRFKLHYRITHYAVNSYSSSIIGDLFKTFFQNVFPKVSICVSKTTSHKIKLDHFSNNPPNHHEYNWSYK